MSLVEKANEYRLAIQKISQMKSQPQKGADLSGLTSGSHIKLDPSLIDFRLKPYIGIWNSVNDRKQLQTSLDNLASDIDIMFQDPEDRTPPNVSHFVTTMNEIPLTRARNAKSYLASKSKLINTLIPGFAVPLTPAPSQSAPPIQNQQQQHKAPAPLDPRVYAEVVKFLGRKPNKYEMNFFAKITNLSKT